MKEEKIVFLEAQVEEKASLTRELQKELQAVRAAARDGAGSRREVPASPSPVPRLVAEGQPGCPSHGAAGGRKLFQIIPSGLDIQRESGFGGEEARSGDPGVNLLKQAWGPRQSHGHLHGTHRCTEMRKDVQVCSWRTPADHTHAVHTRVHTGTLPSLLYESLACFLVA